LKIKLMGGVNGVSDQGINGSRRQDTENLDAVTSAEICACNT